MVISCITCVIAHFNVETILCTNVHRVLSQQMYILHNDASVNSSSVGCSMHVMVCKTDMPTDTCMYTYNTLFSPTHTHTHTSVYPCQKLLPQHVVLLARVPEGLTQCSELRVGGRIKGEGVREGIGFTGRHLVE